MELPRLSQRRGALGLAAATIALALAVLPASATADGGCDRFASPTGNDANPGTEAAPVRSIARLIKLTGPSEEGCLPAGATFVEPIGTFIVADAGGTPGRPARIRTADPDGPAATIKAAMWLQGSVHDLEFERIRFTDSPGNNDKGTMLVVDGDRIIFRETEMTWRRGICLNAGHRDGYATGDPAGTAAAEGLVIERSRIHDCGNSPQIVESLRDESQSGVHGIYLIDAPGARIHDNYIYDNVSRGLQLWPDVDGAVVDHNVFFGNGSNINVGSSAAYGHFSESNRFEDNVVSDAVLRSVYDAPWGPGDTESIVGYFPDDGNTRGNAFVGNCVHQADPARAYGGVGYVHSGDVFAEPGYLDAAAGDFRLQAGSPCTGKGPRVAVIGVGDGAAQEPPATQPSSPPDGGAAAGEDTAATGGAGSGQDAASASPEPQARPRSPRRRRARCHRRTRHRAHAHRYAH
ncbi:MAG: right-handed parallel beta-helix repeat-containing protein [Solirubrobacterales bacterium]